jgi:hypothetical protein
MLEILIKASITIYEDADFRAGEVITILNEDDALSGYCVNIIDNGKPNGYNVGKIVLNGGVYDKI